jgi:hypothetical protein
VPPCLDQRSDTFEYFKVMPFRSSEREALEEREDPLNEATYGSDFEIPDAVTPWPHRPSA